MQRKFKIKPLESEEGVERVTMPRKNFDLSLFPNILMSEGLAQFYLLLVLPHTHISN